MCAAEIIDGTTCPTSTLVTANARPVGLVAGDFNSDGKLDLAIGGDNPAGVTIMQQQQREHSTRTRSEPSPRSLSAQEYFRHGWFNNLSRKSKGHAEKPSRIQPKTNSMERQSGGSGTRMPTASKEFSVLLRFLGFGFFFLSGYGLESAMTSEISRAICAGLSA